jgi:hypothetical protein
MPSLSVQFHALPDELADFVRDALLVHGIHGIAVEHHPFAVHTFGLTDIDLVVNSPTVRQIVFTEFPPNCDAPSNLALLDCNPGALVLNLGRMTPRGLEECQLGSMDASPAWRRAAAVLKKRTSAGVVVVHDETRAESVSRSHRVSPGAAQLAARGVALRQFAQSTVRLEPRR